MSPELIVAIVTFVFSQVVAALIAHFRAISILKVLQEMKANKVDVEYRLGEINVDVSKKLDTTKFQDTINGLNEKVRHGMEKIASQSGEMRGDINGLSSRIRALEDRS